MSQQAAKGTPGSLTESPPAPARQPRLCVLTGPAARSGGEALVPPVMFHRKPAAGAESTEAGPAALPSDGQRGEPGKHLEGRQGMKTQSNAEQHEAVVVETDH